jgi:putative glutamine amidotransferase
MATAQDVPLLAICRGMQVLNVAAGGTLVQDLPSERPSATRHLVATPANALAHHVTVVAGSRLAQALGRDGEVGVNSRHHQALSSIGEGLVVSATAPDGVIEAIERPAARFCVGVQWHPENFWQTSEFAGLFEALVRSAEAGVQRKDADSELTHAQHETTEPS